MGNFRIWGKGKTLNLSVYGMCFKTNLCSACAVATISTCFFVLKEEKNVAFAHALLNIFSEWDFSSFLNTGKFLPMIITYTPQTWRISLRGQGNKMLFLYSLSEYPHDVFLGDSWQKHFSLLTTVWPPSLWKPDSC